MTNSESDAGDPAVAQDAHAVMQLVLRERQCRDRGWWYEMAACFAPEATIAMSWFSGSATEFIRQTQKRSSDGVWGRHRLSPPAVRVAGDRAWAELPLGIEFPVLVSGTEGELISYCRSQYRACRIEGRWHLSRIVSIYERDLFVPSMPGTSIVIEPDELRQYRPSYRCLAWYFAQRVSPLPDDLLGDDQPEPVARYYSAENAWLHGRD